MLRFTCKHVPWSINGISRRLRLQNCRHSSTQTALKQKRSNAVDFEKGNVYHGFLCTDVQDVREFNMKAIMFRHEKTLTEYLHLQRDDPNNVFSLNFRTTPFDSTGLPHILEHTSLCGSKKFPVRDPFFKMMNRSLATFMNAMTGPDYTFYPFSSQNETDYRNLQQIYLDAVFEPNLNSLDFSQEGWRLEYSESNNPNSELMLKGVVFNEMKGVFSENSAIFGQKFLNTILPDHTYGFVSGGDPLEIPNLSVNELREFHSKYYHPSNCKIYSYGNFPVEKNLEICDQLYLKKYDGIDSSYSKVPAQSRWPNPVNKEIRCRFDKMGAPIEGQNQIAVGYLMADITNVYETFVLQVLSELMVMGPNSAFYKSLIEPNISGGYNSLTGYDAQMKDTLFVIGLQDLEKNKFEKFNEIVEDTLDKIIKQGFDKTHLESVLHGIELGIKHQVSNFGLGTLFNLVPLWNHGGCVFEALQVEKFLSKFKNNLKDPNYLTEKVKHYFQSNNHKLTMTMVPDDCYDDNIAKMEEQLLNDKIMKLTDDEKVRIFDEGLQLAKSQKTPQNIELLPCLALADIPKEIKQIKLQKSTIGDIPTQICEANTNNVVYFKAILDSSSLSEKSKCLLPLYCATATKMDMKNYNYREFDQYVNLKTGGINLNVLLSDQINDPTKYTQGVLLSSHCLDHNVNGMLSIWNEIFHKPNFKDTERFKMLFDNYLSSLTTGIASSGHLYAMLCANSLVTDAGLLRENLSGLNHIDFIKNIDKKESIEEIMQNMASISNEILRTDSMRLAVNLTNTNTKGVIAQFENFVTPLSKSKNNGLSLSSDKCFDSNINCIHHVNNFSVNYCAKATYTVPFVHSDFAKLKVLARFLSAKYLHPTIREQNGAYGSGARISHNGVFTFFSYRDPNSRVTLDVFDDVASWLQNCSQTVYDDQAIFESKLGVLQQIDAPVAECNKGIDEFHYGLSTEILQKHRSDVLNVTKDDIIEVCEKYLNSCKNNAAVGKCVIGPGESTESGKSLSKDGENWRTIQPLVEG